MRILLLVSFLVSSTSISLADIDVDSIKNPVDVSKSSISKGKSLYLEHCSVCHGKKGDGKGPSAGSFEMEPWGFVGDELDGVTDGFLFAQIKNGGVSYEMPPFALGLKDQEIWHIVNFLKSLKK